MHREGARERGRNETPCPSEVHHGVGQRGNALHGMRRVLVHQGAGRVADFLLGQVARPKDTGATKPRCADPVAFARNKQRSRLTPAQNSEFP
jgi:hypothetical protein